MKKIISIILSLTLIFSIIPFGVYANGNGGSGEIDISDYTNSELDLSQYTWEDLSNMSAEEYTAFVREFERVYDPYDSYVEEEEPGGGTINPRWISGEIHDGALTEEGCHENITATACIILENDKGFFSNNAGTNIVISLLITLGSVLPDEDEVGLMFAGHFYDPDTGKNYLGSSTNTAKTNAQAHYDAAIAAAEDGEMTEAYEELGRCLHYVQDANEPHHADNVVSTGIFSSHYQFETFAYENQGTYLDNYTSIGNSHYITAANNNTDVADLTHSAAIAAKGFIGYVNQVTVQSSWGYAAHFCLQNAARYSAMVLYKFSTDPSVPFYSN